MLTCLFGVQLKQALELMCFKDGCPIETPIGASIVPTFDEFEVKPCLFGICIALRLPHHRKVVLILGGDAYNRDDPQDDSVGTGEVISNSRGVLAAPIAAANELFLIPARFREIPKEN
jgi:hypothetical protein